MSANPKLNLGGLDLHEVDRLPHRGAELLDLPGVLGGGPEPPDRGHGVVLRGQGERQVGESFMLGRLARACRDGPAGPPSPSSGPFPQCLGHRPPQPDQVAVQGRLAVPPLVVGGLMPAPRRTLRRWRSADSRRSATAAAPPG